MKNQIVISVASSVLTALIIFISGYMFDWFKVEAKSNQIEKVAEYIVKSDDFKKIILDKANESGEYIAYLNELNPYHEQCLDHTDIDTMFCKYAIRQYCVLKGHMAGFAYETLQGNSSFRIVCVGVGEK